MTDSEWRARLDRLTAINRSDLFNSFKLQDLQHGRGVLSAVFTPPARRFARMVLEYDRRVGAYSLGEGSAWILKQLSNKLNTINPEFVPQEGPLLVLCNHPGLADTMALFASLRRNDLQIIAAHRPFLNVLTNTSRQLIYLDEDDPSQHMSTVRTALRHLKSGGTLVTFPGGRIDPDPAVTTGAIESLQHWAPSVGLFIRRVPDARIVVALVSGVISGAALRSPLVKRFKTKADREWAAATLQVLIPTYRNVTISVAFGEPIKATDLRQLDNNAILKKLKQPMIDLIQTHGLPHYGEGGI